MKVKFNRLHIILISAVTAILIIGIVLFIAPQKNQPVSSPTFTIPQSQDVPTTPQSTSGLPRFGSSEYYINKAENHYWLASQALENANRHLADANWSMQLWGKRTSFYDYDMNEYQRLMEDYAFHQQQANQYLIDAQRQGD